jgi:hypothetical protein
LPTGDCISHTGYRGAVVLAETVALAKGDWQAATMLLGQRGAEDEGTWRPWLVTFATY